MQSTDYTPILGGLDLVTPPISISAGRAIGGLNYEPAPAGYQRVDGYERYDGRTRPSSATYYLLNFDAGVTEVTEGQTVIGASSGATGIALIDAVVSSGSYVGTDADGYLVLTEVSGTFQDDENLQVAAATVSVMDGEAILRGADNDTDDTTWIRDAIETARANIQGVNGSGIIRGVWSYGGIVYAFRNNAAGTAGVMHKSSASGWSVVNLGCEISFDAGTAAFTEGATLTGGTSGATATVKREIVESGAFSTSDADGYLILADVVGVFQNNETITDGSGGSATADGADSAITLAPGGIYEFRDHNFYGASDLKRMYGAYGEGKGFEFDGTVFVPIRTGMTVDKPEHVAIHRNHLFFSFEGGSVQHSGTGDPYAWSPILGAAEIAMGDDITGMLEATAEPMSIWTRAKVGILYGNDVTDWDLVTLGDDSGGISRTMQRIGTPLYMDDNGVRTLNQTQKYGNFILGSASQWVEPLFAAKRKAGTTPTASLRIRAKDQYRLFFSDMSGITIYFGRHGHSGGAKGYEILPFNLGKTIYCAASCTCSSEVATGEEKLFFGSDDGFVYQLDKGTSFDGESVEAFLRLPFNHVGRPTQNKNFKKATLELQAAPNTVLNVVAEYSYADPDQPESSSQDFTIQGGGGFWDEAYWNQFYWSSPVQGTAEADIEGVGTNVSIGIVSNETYNDPHTLHGMILHYTLRGLSR